MIRIAVMLALFVNLGLGAQGVTVPPSGAGPVQERVIPFFPGAYSVDYLSARDAREAARPYDVLSETELKGRREGEGGSIFLNNDILAFYGHPLSKNMGILGRYSKEELDDRLTKLAGEYGAVSGGRGVIRAFYLIYGTVWPEGEIGVLKESVIKEYVEYALERGIMVFLDHQIGRYDPLEALKKMLPWLRYPNVHLALDPEWRTDKPMREIGSVRAEEINQAQEIIENYLAANDIKEEKILVIHQFNWRMISGREKVASNFPRVRLIHCADGFGSPDIKKKSYAYNAQAANIPLKGFKLFYNFDIPGAGYDAPLLSPREVYELTPRPYIIMYQ
jgi:hypothetical protein